MGELSPTFGGSTGFQTTTEQAAVEADVRFVPQETFESRFKLTELLLDAGRARYGLWEPPDIRILGGEFRHIVAVFEENRADLISQQFYGTVDLWWAIMHVNNIFLPIRDLFAGLTLIIPFREEVDAALQRVRQ